MRICVVGGCVYPVFSTDKITRKGYCKSHQYLRTDTDKRSIAQKSMEKARRSEVAKRTYDSPRAGLFVRGEVPQSIEPVEGIEQWAWFEERRKEMTGICKHCGGKTCKDDNDKFHFSLAHILPKAYFPSVATNEYNCLELCFWNKNCHGNMDNKILDLIDMNCFDEIITKFLIMYPSIDKKERRRIPAVLMQYVNDNL